jgi:hypothetical protein
LDLELVAMTSNEKKTGLKRQTIDKFYTKPSVAQALVDFVLQHIELDTDHDLLIEPSAGNGSFVDPLRKTGCVTWFYDISPEHPDVQQQDYLEFNPAGLTTKKIHVIGNPPFGRQSTLAIQFIKHSALFAESFSFILPRSFKKDSLMSKVPSMFHLVAEKDMGNASFLVDGNEYEVPCVFQIWKRSSIARAVIEKQKPCGYCFVKYTQPHDIAVRRVGIYAGRVVSTNTSELSPQSHYYIKFDKNVELASGLVAALNSVKYKTKECVSGPCSIGQQDIIPEYNKILGSL